MLELALPVPYLLLVTFATPSLQGLEARHLQALAASAYHGVACPLVSAYDVEPVPAELPALDDAILEQAEDSHLWPWVFLNRVIGHAPGTAGHAHAGAPAHEYFTSIKGMDLWDEAGALSDWMAIWRLSLQVADELDAPGIVLDLEAYNDYRAYDPVYLAERSGKPVEEVIARLKEIGAQMATVIEEERDGALIWTLFSGLDRPRYGPDNNTYYRSVGYVLLGMLEAAQENDIPMTIVSGGSGGIGYYNDSLDRLGAKIAARAEQLAPLLAEPGGLFRLGGTIAPWHDSALLTGWAARVAGEEPPFNSLDDFAPLVEELLRSYDFVWIYAASALGYNPYDPDIATPYNEMLARALEATQR